MTGHSHDGAVHVDILSTGHLGMEAGADLQQGADTSLGTDNAGGGGGDAGEELQQGGLAGAVLADDTDDVALLDIEGDVFQCPDEVAGAFLRTVVGLADL